MNFDELAEFQKQLRHEEDYCGVFISLDAITDEEATQIFDWMMENSLDVDRYGINRMKLLHRLCPCFVAESLETRPGGRTRVIPDLLKSAIESHLLS
jgi:hypothetical protein